MLRLAAALLVALALPAAASASSVTYAAGYVEPPGTEPEESCSRYSACPPSTLEIVGAPGEANRFSVTVEAAVVVVRDAGAALTAGSGCTRADDGAVRCPRAEAMALKAGDGNDEASVGPEFRGSVLGEAGDDVLSGGTSMDGGPGNDILTGTPGTDGLDGGPGADRVMAGEGDDRVTDERIAPAPDLLDGGPGIDVLAFTDRLAPVTADLGPEAQVAGSPAEGNLVGGFEYVGGGDGDDTLRMRTGAVVARTIPLDAGAGDDTVEADVPMDLSAGDGIDLVTAGPGDDRLFGGDGPDHIFGGGGNDIIEDGYDLAADVLEGGSGRDFLTGNGGRDRLLGGASGDVIDGGGGSDRILGGRGPDRITATDRSQDFVDCGADRDRLRADRRDGRRRCERVRLR